MRWRSGIWEEDDFPTTLPLPSPVFNLGYLSFPFFFFLFWDRRPTKPAPNASQSRLSICMIGGSQREGIQMVMSNNPAWDLQMLGVSVSDLQGIWCIKVCHLNSICENYNVSNFDWKMTQKNQHGNLMLNLGGHSHNWNVRVNCARFEGVGFRL